MRIILRGVAFAGAVVIAYVIIAAILGASGDAQTGTPPITRSWPTAGIQATATTTTTTVRPALVRDVDNPDRQTVVKQWTRFGPGGTWSDGFGGCGGGFSIPAGGRMVIEWVSVRASGFPSGQKPYLAMGVSKTGSLDENTATFVALQEQGSHLGTYHYVAAQQVHWIVEKDDWLCENVYSGPDFTGGAKTYMNVSYLGYQITAP